MAKTKRAYNQKIEKYPEKMRLIQPREERLLCAIMDGHEFYLSDKDYRHLMRVKECFALLIGGKTEHEAKQLLKGKGYTQIDRLMKDTQYIFADINKVNAAFERSIQKERIQRHIRAAQAASDWQAVATLEKLYAKVTGTDNHTKETINWNLYNLPELVLTEDISVLEDAEFEDAELIDE